MKQKRTVFIIAALAALLFSGCDSESANAPSQNPIYNSAVITSRAFEIEEPETVTSEAVPDVTIEKNEPTKPAAEETINRTELSSVTDIKMIKRGNSFEENASFGHFCPVENGFYFVDRTDGMLYFMDSDGKRKTVLEDYASALNYYDGFLYYIKGTKDAFRRAEFWYAGSVWRLDPDSGEEVCLIDVPENMVLVVNEYGIFCQPNGGGVALYSFEGEEIRRISDKNQSIDIFGNKMRLSKSDKDVLHDLDTGEESEFPFYSLYVAHIGNRVVCADINDQWNKIVLDLSDGSMKTLPNSGAFAFAVCGNELYAADNTNLYRVDLEKMEYENIISYPWNNPIYFYALHSDGDRLYAVMGNQSDIFRYAEVDTDNGELKYMEAE